MISRDGTSASITETIDKSEAGLNDDIMDLEENTSLKLMNSAIAAIILFVSQVVTKLLQTVKAALGSLRYISRDSKKF